VAKREEAKAAVVSAAEKVTAVATAAVVRVAAMADERSAVHSRCNPCQGRTVLACRTSL